MWSVQRCREVVRRYKEKVRTVPIRKRGNPPDVIKAMAILAGGKQCVKCGNVNTHLHHANGNWRDYSPDNLIFVCKEHHLQLHRELKENTDMNTVDMVNVIRKEVDSMNSKGSTKTSAFKKLSAKYRKSAATIENMYYGRNSYDNPTGKIRGSYTNRTYNRSNVYKVYLTMDKNDISHLLKHLMDDGSKYNSSSFDFSIE